METTNDCGFEMTEDVDCDTDGGFPFAVGGGVGCSGGWEGWGAIGVYPGTNGYGTGGGCVVNRAGEAS